MWARLPGWMRAPISSAIAALPRNETLKRGAYSLAIPERMRGINTFSRSCRETKSTACSRTACWNPIRVTRYWIAGMSMTDLMSETDELGGLQFLEVRSTLPDELLMYADKLSMAHGLELRVPFVDKEIVEYVERLPANLKVRNGSRKWLHRQVCQAYLPDSILKRPKRGFAMNVVDDWFRGTIDSRMNETLLDDSSRIYQYLRPNAVRELFEKHSSGQVGQPQNAV